MTPELPPLPPHDRASDYSHNTPVYNVADVDAAVEARERILLARIAELEADAERRRMDLRKVDTSRVRWAATRFQQPDEADIRSALRSCADAIDAARKA